MIYKINKGIVEEILTEDEFESKYPNSKLYDTGKFTKGFVSSTKLESVLGSTGAFNKNKELLEVRRDLRNKEQEVETLQADFDQYQERYKNQLSERAIEINSLKTTIKVLEDELKDVKDTAEKRAQLLAGIREYVELKVKELN